MMKHQLIGLLIVSRVPRSRKNYPIPGNALPEIIPELTAKWMDDGRSWLSSTRSVHMVHVFICNTAGIIARSTHHATYCLSRLLCYVYPSSADMPWLHNMGDWTGRQLAGGEGGHCHQLVPARCAQISNSPAHVRSEWVSEWVSRV